MNFSMIVNQVAVSFAGASVAGGGYFFKRGDTKPEKKYLSAFVGKARQYHNCHACKEFFRKVGDLYVVDTFGRARHVLSFANYGTYQKAIDRVMGSAPTELNPAEVSREMIGIRRDTWEHFAAKFPIVKDMRATLGDDCNTVMTALTKWKHRNLLAARYLLENDADLKERDRYVGQVTWLISLHKLPCIWRAIAEAPEGFCHFGMLSTLLDDISEGRSGYAARWNAKMHPLRYKRPTALPTEGNVQAAEKALAGIDLRRRFAVMSDIQEFLWKPARACACKFADVPRKHGSPATQMNVSGGTRTWNFVREKLAGAKVVEILVPDHGNFRVLTAGDEKVFKWDNTVSSYVWPFGSSCGQFGLSCGWAPVTGIIQMPWSWDGAPERADLPDGWLALISGACESWKAGLALFPDILQARFFPYRKTIEAYSSGHYLEGVGTLVGLGQWKGSVESQKLRIDGVEYEVDRYE